MRGAALLLLLCVVGAAGCGGGDVADGGLDAGLDASSDAGVDAPPWVPAPFTPTADTRAYCNGDDDAIEAQITTILGTLSARDKIAMLHGAAGGLTGGTWLVRGNDTVGVPGLHMLDGPRGVSEATHL